MISASLILKFYHRGGILESDFLYQGGVRLDQKVLIVPLS
jgi:hypothetical protein